MFPRETSVPQKLPPYTLKTSCGPEGQTKKISFNQQTKKRRTNLHPKGFVALKVNSRGMLKVIVWKSWLPTEAH